MSPSTVSSMSLVGFLGVVGSSFLSVWALVKYVLIGTYKLNGDISKRLIDRIKNDAKWTWVLASEHVHEPRYPEVFEAVVSLDGLKFFFSRSERLMTAGWTPKESVSTITFLRWNRKRINRLIAHEVEKDQISVSCLSPTGLDRLGELSSDPNVVPYFNENSYEDIEDSVKQVVQTVSGKTSFLLYGSPGNGKTQFVKYLARKYSIPIHVVYLNPEYNNFDIAKMFSEIPRRCIVLFEDFDNYFDGRECSMKNDRVRFTFDSIINGLDGVYNDYRGVVFAMTVNDISRVDDSLKTRPSRFKFVREFTPPDEKSRMKILGNELQVKATEGYSLDKVFSTLKN